MIYSSLALVGRTLKDMQKVKCIQRELVLMSVSPERQWKREATSQMMQTMQRD